MSEKLRRLSENRARSGSDPLGEFSFVIELFSGSISPQNGKFETLVLTLLLFLRLTRWICPQVVLQLASRALALLESS